MERLASGEVRPIRMCVACRQRATKRELLRIVAGEDAHGSAVVPDPRGIAAGRGAHLHPTTECFALAERRHAFPRALRVQGGLSTQTLREYVEQLTCPQ
ncbi:MAG: YlxR family protein [Marmoricola sp.]